MAIEILIFAQELRSIGERLRIMIYALRADGKYSGLRYWIRCNYVLLPEGFIVSSSEEVQIKPLDVVSELT